ncbi:hypothetical protein BCUN_1764 [Bifidobacterium cuniculi]|uniref:Uncharacterized protein n=1 Tax=Bifidobacterium cuniculi TaxID=1688 RepID=A0A087AII5_9BIFI|nr:hypothetical protein BCUN_1764 [Bifidobacterium cuniculi]
MRRLRSAESKSTSLRRTPPDNMAIRDTATRSPTRSVPAMDDEGIRNTGNTNTRTTSTHTTATATTRTSDHTRRTTDSFPQVRQPTIITCRAFDQ